MLSFEPLLKKMITCSTKVSYYMLGSSSSNSERDKYINTWIRVQYTFIFLVIWHSRLRAPAKKLKKSKNKSYITLESMR